MIGKGKAYADIQSCRHRHMTLHGATPRGDIKRTPLSRAAFSFEQDGHVHGNAMTTSLLASVIHPHRFFYEFHRASVVRPREEQKALR